VVEVGPYPKRLAWWAKLATWRPKSLLGGQSSHLGEKTHHGKAHYLVGKVSYFTKSSQLTPKVSCLTQSSSIMSKLLDCYLEKVPRLVPKDWLVPKRRMKFSQLQKRTGVGATLKNAIETHNAEPSFLYYIWSSSSVF